METGVLEAGYIRFGRQVDSVIDRILSGPNWKVKALFAVLAISLFRAFPSYDAVRTNFVEWKWRSVQVKFDHPLTDTSRIFPPGSHESNLTFRLTAPIVAHVLRFRQTGMLIFFAFAGVLLLYTSLHLAHEMTNSRKAALFVCVALACVWPGETAFHELRGGYYDALALCLLLLAFSAPSWLLTAIFVFAAAWTDERALIASSFLLLCPVSRKTGVVDLLKGKPAAVVTACVLYFGTRAYLTATYSYSVSRAGIGFSVLTEQANIVPLAVWTGLGASWLLVIMALLTLFFQKRYLTAAGFCGVLAAVAGGGLLVVDVTRSMAYCLPGVFVALFVLSRSEPIKRIERVTAIGAVVSLIVPTYYIEGSAGLWWLYPLPIQIGRWLAPNVMRHLF